MGRAEQESTARIKRETLVGLLDTMAPTDQQPITARVRISDVQAEAARELAKGTEEVAAIAGVGASDAAEVAQMVDARVRRLLDELKAIGDAKPLAASAVPTRAKRASKAPFAHLAALLPPTRAPIRARATTNSEAPREPAEQKAIQVIADVREKLETAKETAARWDAMGERPSFPTLSPQITAELSCEEIAMLPMEIRLMLPEVAPFPRIAVTPLPGADLCIAIHSTPCKDNGHSIRVSDNTDDAVEPAPQTAWSALVLVGYFMAACLAGFGAVYCLA